MGSIDSLVESGIGLTVLLLVVGLVLAPIGLKTTLGVNKSEIGIQSGSTLETIWDNIPVLALVAILLGVIYTIYRRT